MRPKVLRCWAQTCLAGALFVGTSSCECQPTGAPPVASPSPRDVSQPVSLRLATWNMRWLDDDLGAGNVKRSSADYAALAKIAHRLAADVISVQEVEGERALERVFPRSDYEYFLSERRAPQRTGFVVRRGTRVQRNPDWVQLNLGNLRHGTDLSLRIGSEEVRLLSVHLKSGCFAGPLDRKKACRKLSRQVPLVEEWIDAREREGVPFVIVGDFNRRLFRAGGDEVFLEWNDGDPPGLLLWSPTASRTSRCRGGKHPLFIDHFLTNARGRQLIEAESFSELLFEPGESAYRLSDHCPLSISLGSLGKNPVPPPRTAEENSTAMTEDSAIDVARAPRTSRDEPARRPIKGNVSRDGRKIYHLPHCPSYEETRIDEARGERWFADEASAQGAGWTRSNNCPPVK